MIILYKVNNEKDIIEYAEVKVNSYAGSFLFWHQMEDKYLEPDYRGQDANKFLPISRLIPVSFFENPIVTKASEIWDLVDDSRLSLEERIIMCSTFDYGIIKKEYIPILIEVYSSEYATDAMKELVEPLKQLYDEEDCYGLSITWTTVSDLYSVMYDENDNEYYPSLDKTHEGYNEKLWIMFEEDAGEIQLIEEYKKGKK